MKKLNSYIIKQIFVGFLLVTFSLMSILWLTQSLKFVELVTNKGLPVSLFIEMTSLLMPRLFALLSPIAIFVSVLFVYNRMLSDRELVVIKAAGISPWKSSVPVMGFSFLLVLFNLYVVNFAIPNAEKSFNDLEWKVKNDLSHLLFKEGEFTTVQPGLTVFISSQEKDGSITGILVNDERNQKNKVTLSAEKGRIVYTEKNPRIIMVKGVRQEISKTTNQFSSLTFERYSVDFGIEKSSKKKEMEVREQTLFELFNAAQNPNLTEKEVKRYIVEGNKRVLEPFNNILFALIGCTGLLVGNFNRRGQTKIISFSILAMIIVQASNLAFSNMSTKNLYFLGLLYANLLIPMAMCIYLLLFYNPNAVKKRKGERNA